MEHSSVGLHGFDFENVGKCNHPEFEVLKSIWMLDPLQHLDQWNHEIKLCNSMAKSKMTVKLISEEEHWLFHAILLLAVEFGCGGTRLFHEPDPAICVSKPNLCGVMKECQFNQLRKHWATPFVSDTTDKSNPWFPAVELL